MNSQDELASDNVSRIESNGFIQLRLHDGANAVNVVIGNERWDRSHLRRLRQSADLPGLVPVIEADMSSDNKPFVVLPVVEARTLATDTAHNSWIDNASVVEAAARAAHEAHLRGLFHGSLSPDQILMVDGDVAVSGIGLGLGGIADPSYAHWVSPEVTDGADATERSDVFSLGRILEAALSQSIEATPRSVRRLIMWSSSETAEARPPSAQEFASILAEALSSADTGRKVFAPAFIPTAKLNAVAAAASDTVTAHNTPAGGRSSQTTPEITDDIGADSAVSAHAVSKEKQATDLSANRASETMDLDTSGPNPGQGLATDSPSDDPEREILRPEVLPESKPNDANIPSGAAFTGDSAEPSTPTSRAANASMFASSAAQSEMSYKNEFVDADLDRPAAAETVDLDQEFVDDKRGNRAGIVVGAVLAVGLGVVAFLAFSSGSEDTETADSPAAPVELVEEEAGSSASIKSDTTLTKAPTTTVEEVAEDPATTVTQPETDDLATTTITKQPQAEQPVTTVTDEPAEQPATTATGEPMAESANGEKLTAQIDVVEANPGTMITGAISKADAAVQVAHGIPGVTVDLYVDGQALAPGFKSGTIVGPADLPAGSYDVALFAAVEGAPAAMADRSDKPLLAQTIQVGENPVTFMAHLNSDGDPTVSTVTQDLSDLAPAKGRASFGHYAAAPPVILTVDGTEQAGSLSSGQSTALELDPGRHTLLANSSDGTPVLSIEFEVGDGELASFSVIGSAADESLTEIAIVFTGLASAPSAVPTGNSNLLGAPEDQTGPFILTFITAIMALAGGIIVTARRKRSLP